MTASVLKQCREKPQILNRPPSTPSDPRDFTNELYIAQRFQPTDDDVASTITQSSQPIPSLMVELQGKPALVTVFLDDPDLARTTQSHFTRHPSPPNYQPSIFLITRFTMRLSEKYVVDKAG